MTNDLTTPSAVSREILDAAASTCCCRFGHADDEARRRSWVAVLAQASADMARALQAFAHAAVLHGNGMHSTPDMFPEAQRVADAYEAWSLTVGVAAAQHGERADTRGLMPTDFSYASKTGGQATALS